MLLTFWYIPSGVAKENWLSLICTFSRAEILTLDALPDTTHYMRTGTGGPRLGAPCGNIVSQ